MNNYKIFLFSIVVIFWTPFLFAVRWNPFALCIKKRDSAAVLTAAALQNAPIMRDTRSAQTEAASDAMSDEMPSLVRNNKITKDQATQYNDADFDEANA